jgi:hypothetical protein
MRSKLKDWSHFVAPSVALFTALFSNLPRGLSVVICLYLALMLIRSCAVWRYQLWRESSDERSEHLRRLVILSHRIWLVAIFLVPLVTVGSYMAASNIATLADDLVESALQDNKALEKLESGNSLVRLNQMPQLENRRLYAHVLKGQGQEDYLVRADQVFVIALTPVLAVPSEVAVTLWLLLLIALGAFKFTELLGESSSHFTTTSDAKPPLAA